MQVLQHFKTPANLSLVHTAEGDILSPVAVDFDASMDEPLYGINCESAFSLMRFHCSLHLRFHGQLLVAVCAFINLPLKCVSVLHHF